MRLLPISPSLPPPLVVAAHTSVVLGRQHINGYLLCVPNQHIHEPDRHHIRFWWVPKVTEPINSIDMGLVSYLGRLKISFHFAKAEGRNARADKTKITDPHPEINGG